jgi:hypothetical protein
MATMILVKKGDQVQEKIERRVHKFIRTDSLSSVPERQKWEWVRGEQRSMKFCVIRNWMIPVTTHQNLLSSLDEGN